MRHLPPNPCPALRLRFFSRFSFVLGVLCLLLLAVPSAAEGEAEAEGGGPGDGEAQAEALTRAQAVDQLDAPGYAERVRARRALLQDQALDQAALRELLGEARSAEQRAQLLLVAEHHIMRRAREQAFGDAPVTLQNTAAVGFSYDNLPASENPFVNREGVIVMSTMPGFPAYAHLQAGDIILGVAGEAANNRPIHFPITQWISRQISRHRPGDRLSFRLLRAGEQIEVEVVCAQINALNQMYTTDALRSATRAEPFNRLWEQARDQLTAGLPGPRTLTPKVVDEQ